MRRLAIAAAFTALSLAAAPVAARAEAQLISGPEARLKLEAGKGQLIRLSRPARTVFISEPKIADVQVKSPTLVYVMGKAPGSTNLFAVDAKEQVIANLALNVGYDEGRLSQLIRANAPASQVQVTSVNDALILSGKVASPAEGDEVLRIAAAFVKGGEAGGQIINRLTVDMPNQINLRVRVAEVSREASQVLGFNWEALADIGTQGVLGWATGADNFNNGQILRPETGVGAIVGQLKTGSVDINVLLEALSRKDLVTILAEPNLTAVSGEPASFLAGGEYPVPVPQGLDQTIIQFKQFGVSLSFVATVLDGGRISLNVRPEVSQLSNTGAITLNGVTVPALTTRRAETTVELGSGQSFAIAGLIQNNVSQDFRKLPGVGDVPVLGQLFRSKRFQRSESELVIIVTPYLVKPVSRKIATPVDRPIAPPAAVAAKEPPATPETKS